jgi:hypothetical protein
MSRQKAIHRRGVAVVALFAVSLIGFSSHSDAYSAVGTTCSPAGNKGCFAQVLPGGAFNIFDVTWNTGDTGPFFMAPDTPRFASGDTIDFFNLWRNRLATSSRALYLTGSSFPVACYRLVWDSRTWVTHPVGSANYPYSVANSPTFSGYGTCTNV